MRPKTKRGAMSEAKWRTTKACIIYALEFLCVLTGFFISYVWAILIHIMQ